MQQCLHILTSEKVPDHDVASIITCQQSRLVLQAKTHAIHYGIRPHVENELTWID
jgi:hypothetical protein